MQINKIYKDIYEIENFISVEDQEEIINMCNNMEEKEWFENDEEAMEFSWWNGRQMKVDHIQVFQKISQKVASLFDSLLSGTGVALQRYKVGDNIQPHRDYWKYDEPYHIRYGIVIYYNDNYSGGEIEYPEVGIVHKPKPRSLVMHGGNVLHGTLPVKEGVRYFSTCFIKGSSQNPVVLNQDFFKEIEENDGTTYR